MTTQDSQSELEFWEGVFGKSTNAKGNTEGYITYPDFTERLNAYVTTRVKEAERLARIDGQLSLVQIIIQEWQDFPNDGDFTNWLFNKQSKLQALTTTTNGKGE